MDKASQVSLSSLPFPIDPDQTHHPWLLVSQGNNLQRHTFYSVSKNEHLKKNISEFQNKLILSTCYGWLALIDLETRPAQCCLMNIASKERIQLPNIEPKLKTRLFNCVLSKPPGDPDCHVLLLPFSDQSCLFCRLGDQEYTKTCCPGDFFHAATSYRGKIIAWMSRSCSFFEIDFVDKELIFRQLVNDAGRPCQIPWPSPSTSSIFGNYFVESCCGDLLLVHLICKHTSEEVAYFRIFKVHESSELRSIGDRTIFLNTKGKSICCCSSGETKKNSIYYIWRDRYFYVYDIEDRSITPFKPCPIKRGGNFIMSWLMM